MYVWKCMPWQESAWMDVPLQMNGRKDIQKHSYHKRWYVYFYISMTYNVFQYICHGWHARMDGGWKKKRCSERGRTELKSAFQYHLFLHVSTTHVPSFYICAIGCTVFLNHARNKLTTTTPLHLLIFLLFPQNSLYYPYRIPYIMPTEFRCVCRLWCPSSVSSSSLTGTCRGWLHSVFCSQVQEVK